MSEFTNERRLTWRSGLDLVASIAMIAAAGTLLFGGRVGVVAPLLQPKSPGLPEAPVPLDGLAIKGMRTAPAGLILYSDFQCPFCRRFARDVLPVVERELVESGQLLVAFKHLPLEAIHPQAIAAASVAECGRREGKFWLFHDRLFAEPALSTAAIEAIAQDEAIASRAECITVDGPQVVREHQRDAAVLGISSTPTFLIGKILPDGRLVITKILNGFQSFETVAAVVRNVGPDGR